MFKSRSMRLAGHVACMAQMRNTYGKPEGKRPFGIPRCSWENNIKMDLKEIG
jgi:hypothetical protein